MTKYIFYEKVSQSDFRGPKIPPEVRVQHETCSTTCETPVQAILDQKKLTGLAGGVREGPNIAKYGPRFWLLSPLEAPKWVQDPENGPQMIPPNCP